MADTPLPNVTGSQSQAPQPTWRTALSSTFGFVLKQREASIAVIAVALIIYFQSSNSAFLSAGNLPTLAQYSAERAIIAAGEVMLMICGEIDLSVGNVYALAPFIMLSAVNSGLPLVLAIIVGLIASAAIGLVNGAVTTYLKVPSFITTLGTLYLLNGLTLEISNAFPKATPALGSSFAEAMGHGPYSEIIWAIAIIIVMQIVLNWTPWGLHTVSTGSNPLGSSEVGVNTNRIRIISFMLCSILGGFAGILGSFRITSIDPLAGGTDIMFYAVAGAVIGGTALNGGSGTIIGAFLGVFVIGIIQDGLAMLGVSAFEFNLILGAAILVAMIMNVRLQVLRKAGRE
jgi:simple sugar transport system permease protein